MLLQVRFGQDTLTEVWMCAWHLSAEASAVMLTQLLKNTRGTILLKLRKCALCRVTCCVAGSRHCQHAANRQMHRSEHLLSVQTVI